MLLVILDPVCGQKKARQRSRGKKAKTGSCHLKEIDACLSKLDKYTNNRNSSNLLTTERGIDEICT